MPTQRLILALYGNYMVNPCQAIIRDYTEKSCNAFSGNSIIADLGRERQIIKFFVEKYHIVGSIFANLAPKIERWAMALIEKVGSDLSPNAGTMKNNEYNDGQRRRMVFGDEKGDGESDEDGDEEDEENDNENGEDDDTDEGNDDIDEGEDEIEEGDDVDEGFDEDDGMSGDEDSKVMLEEDDMVAGAARWKKNIASKAKEGFIQRQLHAKNLHAV